LENLIGAAGQKRRVDIAVLDPSDPNRPVCLFECKIQNSDLSGWIEAFAALLGGLNAGRGGPLFFASSDRRKKD
jgi:hypothetical protein